MSKNITQWCVENNVRDRVVNGQHSPAFQQIQSEVDKMTSDNHSQILLMRYGKVFVNTNERGLVYFTMKTTTE